MTIDHHERAGAIGGPPAGPSDRSFGLTVGGILIAIGAIRIGLHGFVGDVSVALFAVGGVLVALALVRPSSLKRVNRLWMRLGELMARIMNPVILFLVFIIAFVPIGLFLRLRGHDPLQLKAGASAGSHWIRRPSPDPMISNIHHQF